MKEFIQGISEDDDRYIFLIIFSLKIISFLSKEFRLL
jgi:hypothetical protein